MLVLLHAATSDGDRLNLHVVAQTLAQLGWAHAGGAPILAGDVQWIWNDVWVALGNVGPRPDASRLRDRMLSAAAVTLTRDVLLTPRADQQIADSWRYNVAHDDPPLDPIRFGTSRAASPNRRRT